MCGNIATLRDASFRPRRVPLPRLRDELLGSLAYHRSQRRIGQLRPQLVGQSSNGLCPMQLGQGSPLSVAAITLGRLFVGRHFL